VEYVRNIYQGRRGCIITANGLTGEFPIERGISQGDPLSCLLFDAFMELLLVAAAKTGLGYVLADGRKVAIRAFADDLILMGETRAQVEGLLGAVMEGIEGAGMRLNRRKCEYLTNSSCKSPLGLAGRPEQIRCLKRGESCRYLGVWLDEDLAMKQHSTAVLGKVLGRVGRIVSKRPPLALGIQLLNECCTPCLQYPARNYPLKADVLERVSRAYRKAVAVLMGRGRKGDMQASLGRPALIYASPPHL